VIEEIDLGGGSGLAEVDDAFGFGLFPAKDAAPEKGLQSEGAEGEPGSLTEKLATSEV
jgi:hypothetical protein